MCNLLSNTYLITNNTTDLNTTGHSILLFYVISFSSGISKNKCIKKIVSINT